MTSDKEQLEAWNQALERTKHHDFEVSSNAYAELQNADLDMLSMLNRMQAEIEQQQAAYTLCFNERVSLLAEAQAQLSAKDKLLVMAREILERWHRLYAVNRPESSYKLELCKETENVLAAFSQQDADTKETLTALGEV